MTTSAETVLPAQPAPPDTLEVLIDAHDLSSTLLGDRKHWPISLRLIVDTMLGSGHAMCLAWGDERTFLYNDAYAPFLDARHPAALGMSMQEVWSDVWAEIGPLSLALLPARPRPSTSCR